MNMTEVAYNELRARIISHEIPPNQKLDITKLQAVLGFSKMPIVDALNRLRSEGLVVSRHRVGTFAAPLSEKLIKEVFEARDMLEQRIVPLALLNVSNRQIGALQELLDEASQLVKVDDEEKFDYAHYMEIDHQFHRDIIQLAELPMFDKWFSELTSHMMRARNLFKGGALSRSLEGQIEHQAILNAISSRDTDKTRHVMADHTSKSRTGALLRLTSNPPAPL
jgi:DNA-binding GntR family transcriptional regulator